MNCGKGCKCKFPHSLTRLLIIRKQFIDYRCLDSIMRKLFQLDLIPKYTDLSTIWNRIHSSMPEISLPQFNETEIATDGSGLKTSNTGEYRILKYGDNNARKKHPVIIAADVKHKKLLCKTVRIEDKEHTEASIAMEQTSHILQRDIKIRKFYGDGAFDQSSTFNKLHSIGAKPMVKIRKNASTDYYNGSKYHRRIVKEYKNLGYESWFPLNNYGMRWPRTDSIFSGMKRKFGENTFKIRGRSAGRVLPEILDI
ncbi:MAG: IS5/IS1182 family transposase [Conexivisphaerales archaeon]